MSDLIEVYTRLKMKTDCLITLTYFSSYGYETTKKYKLIDIVGFSYILVENEEEMLSIPFFGKDTMIKSITIDNSKESIYFNKSYFIKLKIRKREDKHIFKLVFFLTVS